MFEVPQDKQETKTMRLLIGGALLGVLLVLAVIYFASRRGAEGLAVSPVPAATCAPDAVNDLKPVNVKMDKDYSGTWAVWAVRLRNASAACAYSAIEYETTYVRGDDTVILVNKGTLPRSIAPGEEENFPALRDVLFPPGTAWFRFKITGAKVATP